MPDIRFPGSDLRAFCPVYFRRFSNIGGGGRDRTDDLRLAKPALSQLSYAPFSNIGCEYFGSVAIEKWWAWVDLNYRPHAYQACALTKLSYRPISSAVAVETS